MDCLERILRGCAYELAAVFKNIFNMSLSQAIVPPCFKSPTIIPVPKKPAADSLNDYRPIPIATKLGPHFSSTFTLPIVMCAESTNLLPLYI